MTIQLDIANIKSDGGTDVVIKKANEPDIVVAEGETKVVWVPDGGVLSFHQRKPVAEKETKPIEISLTIDTPRGEFKTETTDEVNIGDLIDMTMKEMNMQTGDIIELRDEDSDPVDCPQNLDRNKSLGDYGFAGKVRLVLIATGTGV